MGQYLDLILAAAKRTRSYADKLTVGIKPDQAARKPHFETGGAAKVVDTNHPTFVYGHLALYPARLLTLAGLDGASVAAPAEWEPLFKASAPCNDDPAGTIYPRFELATAHFFKATDAALVTLAKLDDKALLVPTPDERYRESFPLTGSALAFMLNNHPMMHLGQVSAWRRCFGLPSAF